MPHTPSAWKRLRKSEKRRRQNRVAAKKIKLQRREVATTLTTIESSKTAIAAAKPDTDTTKAKTDLDAATAKAPADIKTTQVMLDRAATKGYIHPNKAARLKSRLVKRARAATKCNAFRAPDGVQGPPGWQNGKSPPTARLFCVSTHMAENANSFCVATIGTGEINWGLFCCTLLRGCAMVRIAVLIALFVRGSGTRRARPTTKTPSETSCPPRRLPTEQRRCCGSGNRPGIWFDKAAEWKPLERTGTRNSSIRSRRSERRSTMTATFRKRFRPTFRKYPCRPRRHSKRPTVRPSRTTRRRKKIPRRQRIRSGMEGLRQGKRSVDLLALVDTKAHTLAGEWKKDGKALVGTAADKWSVLQLPYEPGEEYDLELTCRRVKGDDCLTFGLVAGGRQFTMYLDGFASRGYETGFELVDEKLVTTFKGGPLLKLGKDTAITFSVRAGEIDLFVGGKPITNFKGDFARLSLHEGHRTPNAKALFLRLSAVQRVPSNSTASR